MTVSEFISSLREGVLEVRYYCIMLIHSTWCLSACRGNDSEDTGITNSQAATSGNESLERSSKSTVWLLNYSINSTASPTLPEKPFPELPTITRAQRHTRHALYSLCVTVSHEKQLVCFVSETTKSPAESRNTVACVECNGTKYNEFRCLRIFADFTRMPFRYRKIACSLCSNLRVKKLPCRSCGTRKAVTYQLRVETILVEIGMPKDIAKLLMTFAWEKICPKCDGFGVIRKRHYLDGTQCVICCPVDEESNSSEQRKLLKYDYVHNAFWCHDCNGYGLHIQ